MNSFMHNLRELVLFYTFLGVVQHYIIHSFSILLITQNGKIIPNNYLD